ncbi:MAG: hypothetical protein AB7N71_06335, partial [Phycisphaerae bacterium]
MRTYTRALLLSSALCASFRLHAETPPRVEYPMYPLERKEGGGVPRDDSGTLPESSRPAIPSPPVPAERVAERKSYPSSTSRSTNRVADRP